MADNTVISLPHSTVDTHLFMLLNLKTHSPFPYRIQLNSTSVVLKNLPHSRLEFILLVSESGLLFGPDPTGKATYSKACFQNNAKTRPFPLCIRAEMA
jgi:hypothetical protein